MIGLLIESEVDSIFLIGVILAAVPVRKTSSAIINSLLSTALSSGLSGGNGDPVVIHADTAQFEFDANNRLKLKSTGSQNVMFSSFDTNSINSCNCRYCSNIRIVSYAKK